MFSFGLAFLFRNAVYLLFSMVMGYLGYKMYKLKKVGVIVFLIVWMLPYYDLFIQKGIKTYYETFKMDNTIYAYPERDENGLIESLGIGKVVSKESSGYLHNQQKLNKFKNFYAVKNFVEFYFFGFFEQAVDKDGKVIFKDNYQQDFGYARVYLDETPMRYEKLKDESEYKARYQVLGKEENGIFYDKTIIEFWDMKEHKLLAEGFKLSFYTKDYDQKFRNKYLLFRGPSGVSLSSGALSHYGFDFRKTFYNTQK